MAHPPCGCYDYTLTSYDLYANLITIPEAEHLYAVYDLTPPVTVQELGAAVYAVSGTDGAFILKLHDTPDAISQQRYEHWLLLALSDQKLPFAIPAPIRTRQGATFYQPPTGELWVLSPHLSGEGMIPNDPDQAYAAGEALAQLHHALGKIQPLVRPDFPDYNLNARTLLHLRGSLPSTPADLGLGDTPEGRHRLKRFLNLAGRFQTPPPEPNVIINWHIIHGDFFGANLRYDGEQVVGVLDWEFARPDYRAREFAETLLRVANDLGPLFWGTARSFVDGYAQHLSLTRAEIELLPRFIVEYQVDMVLFYGGTQPQSAARALRVQEDISAWLEVEQDRLLAMMRGQFLGE